MGTYVILFNFEGLSELQHSVCLLAINKLSTIILKNFNGSNDLKGRGDIGIQTKLSSQLCKFMYNYSPQGFYMLGIRHILHLYLQTFSWGFFQAFLTFSEKFYYHLCLYYSLGVSFLYCSQFLVVGERKVGRSREEMAGRRLKDLKYKLH